MSPENEASDKLLVALKNDELRFNSATLEKLSKALQDIEKKLIGLHGERGSGKTKLVGLVLNKVQSLKMFDAVLFVSISKIGDHRKIRTRIAEDLNQRFGRAKELKSRLGRNQILVILDDVPAKFDPWECMGTFCSDPQFKFLLTARSDQDFISLLDENIQMGRLSSEDTWSLFRELSGIRDESNPSKVEKTDFNNQYWFPGSTIEIVSFLKGRPPEEWKGILNGLRLQASTRYDIFLSFKGEDTKDFKSALCDVLREKGLTRIFENDTEMGDVDSTSQEHLDAIEDSILSIVVLSENYVGSAKCLDELVHIMRCKNTKNQQIWPIYYTEISLFIKHPESSVSAQQLRQRMKNDRDKTEIWKQALREVSRLPPEFTHERYGRSFFSSVFIITLLAFISSTIYTLLNRPRSFARLLAFWSVPLWLLYCSLCYVPELFLRHLWGLDRHIITKDECEFELFFAQDLLVELKNNQPRFNSTTLKELSKELQDDSIYIIGLYGQKGSGKTTLLEAVRDKVESLNLFDVVLFVTVSEDPNIRSIQDKIAESLDLKFGKENKLERALKIESALKSIKRILVILDDVPEKFDVEYIGIPCNNGQCKFLLTKRSKQDCSLIISDQVTDCQRMIPMRHLPEEEAWTLLQKHSGIKDEDNGSSSNLFHVAKEIAFNYKWFP